MITLKVHCESLTEAILKIVSALWNFYCSLINGLIKGIFGKTHGKLPEKRSYLHLPLNSQPLVFLHLRQMNGRRNDWITSNGIKT